MAQEITNFARFYGLLKLMPGMDKEELKRNLVSQWTCGRTDSLKEMTPHEYYKMCDHLDYTLRQEDHRASVVLELKRQRSICLKLMQKLGIDTTDWTRINAFCQDGRIAGQPFGQLTSEELEQLSRKLRSIERKGGIRQLEEPGPTATIVPFNR